MTEEKRFRVMNHDDYELDYIAMATVSKWKRMDLYDVCDLLNKQEDRIQELEEVVTGINKLNDKLIHENNTFKDQQRAYCNNCELAKTQHEQIQELKIENVIQKKQLKILTKHLLSNTCNLSEETISKIAKEIGDVKYEE